MSRPRHDSFPDTDTGYSPNLQRSNRFPSSQITSDMFVSVGWAEETARPPPPPRKNSDSPLEKRFNSVVERTRNMSRTTLIGLVIGALVILLLVILVVLCVIFIPKISHTNPKNVYTTASPTTPIIPYPTGYVRSSSMIVFKTTENVESMKPSLSNNKTYYGLGSESNLLIFSETEDSPTEIHVMLDRGYCQHCDILNVNSSCTRKSCSANELIFCCSGCADSREFCSVGGANYTDFANISSYSYDSTTSLEFSTINSIFGEDVEFQKHIFNARETYNGQSQTAVFAGETIIQAATASRRHEKSVDYLVALDSNGGLHIYDCESTNTTSIPNYVPTTETPQLTITIYEEQLYIGVSYSDKFYILLYTADGSVQMLEGGYFGILYPLEIQGAFWQNDLFCMWFKQKNNSVGVLKFEIRWNKVRPSTSSEL